MWGSEETGILGVKVAGASRVMGGRGEWYLNDSIPYLRLSC